jgi:hypothetical protein
VLFRLWQGLLTAVSHAGDSWVGQQLTSLSQGLRRAVSTSVLATLGQWARSSFLYRWLTAEPDPDVIVIDLRETYTVGPVLAILDAVLAPLARAWRGASVESAAQSLEAHLRRHPVRVVSLLVLVALLTELGVTLVFRSPSQTGLGVRLLFVGIALAGTRIGISWDECTDSVTYRALVAALEPPEPPSETEENTRK